MITRIDQQCCHSLAKRKINKWINNVLQSTVFVGDFNARDRLFVTFEFQIIRSFTGAERSDCGIETSGVDCFIANLHINMQTAIIIIIICRRILVLNQTHFYFTNFIPYSSPIHSMSLLFIHFKKQCAAWWLWGSIHGLTFRGLRPRNTTHRPWANGLHT